MRAAAGRHARALAPRRPRAAAAGAQQPFRSPPLASFLPISLHGTSGSDCLPCHQHCPLQHEFLELQGVLSMMPLEGVSPSTAARRAGARRGAAWRRRCAWRWASRGHAGAGGRRAARAAPRPQAQQRAAGRSGAPARRRYGPGAPPDARQVLRSTPAFGVSQRRPVRERFDVYITSLSDASLSSSDVAGTGHAAASTCLLQTDMYGTSSWKREESWKPRWEELGGKSEQGR